MDHQSYKEPSVTIHKKDPSLVLTGELIRLTVKEKIDYSKATVLLRTKEGKYCDKVPKIVQRSNEDFVISLLTKTPAGNYFLEVNGTAESSGFYVTKAEGKVKLYDKIIESNGNCTRCWISGVFPEKRTFTLKVQPLYPELTEFYSFPPVRKNVQLMQFEFVVQELMNVHIWLAWDAEQHDIHEQYCLQPSFSHPLFKHETVAHLLLVATGIESSNKCLSRKKNSTREQKTATKSRKPREAPGSRTQKTPCQTNEEQADPDRAMPSQATTLNCNSPADNYRGNNTNIFDSGTSNRPCGNLTWECASNMNETYDWLNNEDSFFNASQLDVDFVESMDVSQC